MPLIAATCASAQFAGDYAADTWMVHSLVGGSATFSVNGGSLTIIGPDDLMYGNIDVTHVVTGDGTWSFDWSYTTMNTSTGYDYSYYLLNGTPVFLATSSAGVPPITGSVSVLVSAGDVIGWGVVSTDGIFGPGMLTIANFQIPAPGAFVLFGLAGIPRARRRE